MSEQKHFKYEAQEPLVSNPVVADVEIKDVRFLTPAKISMKVDGDIREEVLSIDIISRKAYQNNKELPYSEKIFEYLDSINNLPENFFEASDDIYNKAEQAHADHDQMQGENYGTT